MPYASRCCPASIRARIRVLETRTGRANSLAKSPTGVATEKQHMVSPKLAYSAAARAFRQEGTAPGLRGRRASRRASW